MENLPLIVFYCLCILKMLRQKMAKRYAMPLQASFLLVNITAHIKQKSLMFWIKNTFYPVEFNRN
jgi:hypothetical protein